MIWRIIVVSLRNLRRRPFHTFLILQGVIWGTALGVFPPAVINGTVQRVEEQATQLGTDRLLLSQDTVGAAHRFDWSLVEQLRRQHAALIQHATGLAPLGGTMKSGVNVLATDAAALPARGLTLAQGRSFATVEVQQARPVCIVEHHLAAGLPHGPDLLGQTLELGEGFSVTVVGLTAPRPVETLALDNLGYRRDHPLRGLVEKFSVYMGYFEDSATQVLTNDRAVMVPHTLFPDQAPQWIEMRARPRDVLTLRKRLLAQLTRDGYEPLVATNAVLPVLYGETLKTALELNQVVFVLSVLVGTAVVCALMMLSVVERQREIAIRRVEGARRWHIGLQFMVETGTLCAVGGVLGVPLGIVLAVLRCAVEQLGSVTWTFPVAEALLVVALVTAIGLFGGLLPAWRAVRVDPVEMLRYE